MIQCFETEDAETILLASGTIATTAREVVRRRRAAGEKVGLIKIKMFRPFPEARLRDACRTATKLAVLDRNYAAGLGGVFWQDTRATFQGHRDDLLIQGYLTGVCGGDVTPAVMDQVLSDLTARTQPCPTDLDGDRHTGGGTSMSTHPGMIADRPTVTCTDQCLLAAG